MKTTAKLIAPGIVALCVITLLTGLLRAGTRVDLQNSTQDAIETIDLTQLTSRSGRTMAEAIKGYSLVMAVLVDPNCGTCAASKDSFSGLQGRVENTKIKYVVIMLPASTETRKYFDYADSLKLEAESFVWYSTEAKPPSALTTLTAPAHVLMDNEGRIVNKWLGTPPSVSTP